MKRQDPKTAARRGASPARLLLVGLLSTFALMGTDRSCCRPDEFPSVRKDDAGNLSWVRQAVPVLLGRKVKGYDELKFLADLVAASDRATVARALMQQPEFRAHWSEVLVDQLRVDREGDKSFDPNDPFLDPSQRSPCYAAPLRGGAPTGDLAQHILDNPPAVAAPGGAFNMSDVVLSALALDNLASLPKAHLFALEHRPLYPFDDPQVREDLGRTFDETYLNRQLSCLQCHNSDSSTTGPDSHWTRWFPIQGSFEKALYGASIGIPADSAHAMFRFDQHGDTAAAGYVSPWNISGCGFYRAAVPGASDSPFFTGALPSGSTVSTLADLFTQGYQGLAAHGLQRSLPPEVQSACQVCQTSCSGGAPADPTTATNGLFVRSTLTNPDAAANGCGRCHGAVAGLWFTGNATPWYQNLINVSSSSYPGMRVNPGNADASVLIKKLRGDPSTGGRMPPGGPYLDDAGIQQFVDWVNALPSATACASCPSLNCDPTVVVGTEAFAYLTAERLVDVVWQEAMGYRLTIANYFPRNFQQRQALWNLTEHVFIPHHWSLQELLVAIVTSDLFNRHAPQALAAGQQPYELPMIYDPWVAADPRGPPVTDPGYRIQDHPDTWHNAMTDGIYRYSARNLLSSVHQAMGWPEPQRFPPTSGYPDQALELAIGQYYSSSNPGFRTTNFQALLHWEKVHGMCPNKNPGGAPDWISRVVTAAGAFTPPSGEGPLTLRDLLVLERDWLLADGTLATAAPPPLSQSEEAALAALLGTPLSTSASSLAPATLDAKLRSACGVLLESPQFFLAGVAPEGAGPRPRLRVCNGGPCSYLELCNDLASKVQVPGRTVSCQDGSVSLPLVAPVWGIDRFCPNGLCRFVGVSIEQYLRNPKLGPPRPPACDPRCSRIDCCGGALPPPEKEQDGVFLAWADGAQVSKAEGVTLIRGGQRRALEPGEKVAYGDLLEVPPTATLELAAPGGDIASAPARGGQQKLAPRRMLITGDPALKDQEKSHVEPPLSKQQLDWIHTRGSGLFWSDTRPRGIKPSQRGPGQAEKHWPKPVQPTPDELKRLQGGTGR